MKIKSLDDLKKIRKKAEEGISTRIKRKDASSGRIELMIGTATCGIAAGGKETAAAMREEIGKAGLDYINVIEVGCIGYCHSEPVVQVNVPGEPAVFYGKVDASKGRDIIRKHILDGELLQESILEVSFDNILL